MTELLTVAAQICCQSCRIPLRLRANAKLRARGSQLLTEPDVGAALIAGCPQTGPGQKPCTAICTILGGLSDLVRIGGLRTVTAEIEAISDGNPPQKFAFQTDRAAIVALQKHQSWFRIVVRNRDGAPVRGERVRVELPGGAQREARLSDEGVLELRDVPMGARAKVFFLDLV